MDEHGNLVLEKMNGVDVTPAMLEDAAAFFSAYYGVWGPDAPSYAKPGKRIRMSADRLRTECLPASCITDCTYIRLRINGQLVGNVFACTWDYMGRKVCWVTQLVVDTSYRSRGIATQMLISLYHPSIRAYGILSSHAHACMAAIGAFGRTIHNVNLDVIREHAASAMAASPVPYVRNARVHGNLFDPTLSDGSVSSANTDFFVDHTEPIQALHTVGEAGVNWPFGELPKGHEFLVFIKARNRSAEGRSLELQACIECFPRTFSPI